MRRGRRPCSRLLANQRSPNMTSLVRLAFATFIVGSSCEACIEEGGCADQSSLLQTETDGYRQKLFVAGFQPYYDYDGPLTVSGIFVATFKGTRISLDWDLTGADANCGFAPLPNGQISNDCGVHIHTKNSCDEDAGPHFWKPEGADDPWTNIHYTVSAALKRSVTTLGMSIAKRVHINAGITMDDALGRAVVIHDIDGTRIACGILLSKDQLDKAPLQVKSFMPYPGYTGPLRVIGSMHIATMENVQYLSWDFHGGDHNCGITTYPNGRVSNDCGVHIHVGRTCDVADEVGGHYYHTSVDPWTHVHYSSYGGKAISSSDRVEAMLSAFGISGIIGRAVVVHDLEGKRIACGLISRC